MPGVPPGEVSHNENQPLLAWRCAHGGAAVLLALPSSPPQIHSPWFCMGGGLKSSLSLFDRCNRDETKKDAKKDPESKEPPSSIKG